MSFTPTTIAQQLDGRDIQTSLAEVMIQQGLSTFRSTVRPNPDRQINVINDAQIETAFPGRVIPDFTAASISIDKSFDLTKGFLGGEGSTLELFAPIAETVLGYNEINGKLMKQNTANPIRALLLNNIQINAITGTETFADNLIGSSRLFIDNSRLTNFANLGTITFPFVSFSLFAPVSVKRGFILKEVRALVMRSSLIRNSTPLGTTFLSVISNGVPISFLTDDSLASTLLAGDNMFYFDPLSAAGTGYSIKDTQVAGGGNFYQLGVNAIADAIVGAPAGSIRLIITAHELNVGQVVNVSGFVVNTDYNITTPVTAIIDVNTVEVEGTFGTAETGGNLNANSLDGTSVLVSASDNPGVPDSMSQSASRTSRTLEVDGSGGIDVPIVDISPVSGDWIQDINTEEFTVDPITGLITYNAIQDKKYVLQYQLTAVPTSGPSQIIDFDVHINGIAQPKVSTTLNTANATKIISIGGIFEFSNGDTIQLFKENLTNLNNTSVSDPTFLITSS